MDLDSPLLAQLLKAFSNTYEVGCLEPIVFRSASLRNGPDGFLSRRTRKFRSNLRRAVTKGGDAGLKFTRYVATTPKEAEAGFRRMAAIERTSWKGIENCGMTEEPFCSFYEKVYTRMCRNQCGLAIFAQHEGKDIGFVMGGVDGICYRGQQFSFAHEWAPYSVGNLLQWEMIQWLCELGIQRYDMGSVLEYKALWAEIEALSHTLVWRRL
jgi:CelD/BcsL family acetyltransferase involved in cellulose biosynthesis